MKRLMILFAVAQLLIPALLKADDDIQFYGPSWADSSGKDGKGGVSILVSGDKHAFVLRPESCKTKIDSKTLGEHPEWVVYDSEDSGNCLSYEFTWVTTPTDKAYGKMWGGGGVAFNNSWGTIDISQAQYLVLSAKTNAPDVDMNLSLSGTTDQNSTGSVKLSDYAEGHKIGADWTQIVIPLASIPSLSKLDLTQVKMLRFDLAGSYPENEPIHVYFDKVYFSSAKLMTPVENLGWLRTPGGLEVIWDKSDDKGVERYLVTVDGKIVGRVDGPGKRRVKLPPSVLPGSGSHVVGVAASGDKKTSAYQSVTVTLAPALVEQASVSVDGKPDHPVSPWLFGFNFMSGDTLKAVGGTLNRWGGNTTSTYNWKDDADNKGADWYFLNGNGHPPGTPENQKAYYQLVQDSFSAGANAIITIPITGWVAKAPLAGQRLCSFPLSLYPGQTGNDGQGAGNGILANGFVWGNDPTVNYVPSDVDYQEEWVKTIVKEFGSSDKSGVKFYQMDNEPGLWDWNHRDIRPKGVGYDELADLNARYAAMVKSVDPDAQVIGMTAWGVKEMAGSAWDWIPGGVKNYKDPNRPEDAADPLWTDRKVHGDLPQIAWFLKEMNRRSKLAGVRLIDYVDDHGFPEVWGKDAAGKNVNVLGDFPYDPVLTPKQFDALRIFYDPTFTDPDSWCASPGLKPYLFDPFCPLIPKLKAMIAEYYPGTKLSMTEYYPASSSYYHGGLIEAVTLGIYMREGMDLACDWGTRDKSYVFYGHRLFSNYDGMGDKVGGDYVKSSSSSPDLYSFAAKEGAKTYVILVNKNHDTDLDTVLDLPQGVTGYHTYTLTESAGKRIYDSGEKSASGAELKLDVPAFSALLVVAR